MHPANKYVNPQTWRCLILLLLAVCFFQPHSLAYSPDAYRIRRVVIDPGHGGRDYGAIGRLGKEKDINLAIALKLGHLIETNLPDVKVIYTRTEDVFIGLDERSQIANENGADLFISIHCNSNTNRTPYGAETYVMGHHRSKENLEVAMRENAVITYEEDYTTKYEGYDPNSEESFIIFNLIQSSFEGLSLGMAAMVQDEFRERARRKDRGVKQAGFLVLWKVSMPSVLLEVGFISNPKEEEFLLSESGQDYIASAIFRAFRKYKEDVESRSSFMAQTTFNQSFDSTSSDETSTISSQWSDKQNNPILSSHKGIRYMVQIAASSRQTSTEPQYFKGLKGVQEYKADGIYKYVVGSKLNYAEIVEYCQKIRELFPDAFVVAFENGNQIPLDQAIKSSTN